MKTLFLKSNILHIRTNEGEFEVSNPEAVHTSPLVQFHRKWNEGNEVEWPYGVDLIKQRGAINLTVARLIPEEKKEFKPAQPTPNFPKGGMSFTEDKKDRLLEVIKNKSDQLEAEHKARLKGDLSVRSDAQHPSFTESAYKEFEEEDKFSIPSVRNSPRSWPEDYEHENGNYISVRCKPCMQSVESSEPQEIGIGIKSFTHAEIITPSESQEELWKIVYGASNTITRDGFIESMKEHFKITRKPE